MVKRQFIVYVCIPISRKQRKSSWTNFGIFIKSKDVTSKYKDHIKVVILMYFLYFNFNIQQKGKDIQIKTSTMPIENQMVDTSYFYSIGHGLSIFVIRLNLIGYPVFRIVRWGGIIIEFMLNRAIILSACLILAFTSCPAIQSNTFSSSYCVFNFHDSSPTCPFSNCTLSSGATSYDWNNCIQTCCYQMKTPANQDAAAAKDCARYSNYMINRSDATPLKEILVIVGITIGSMLLGILSIKIFGKCCCDEGHCCYYERACSCLITQQTRTRQQRRVRRNVSQQHVDQRQSMSIKTISKDESTESILETWNSDQQPLDSHICSICLEQRSNLMLQCGHWFHHECIGTWMSAKKQCPNCKRTQLQKVKVYCESCNKNWEEIEEGWTFKGKMICRPCKSIQSS